MKKKKVIRALALIMAATSVTTGTIPVFATGTGAETEMAASGTNGDVSFELDIKDSFNLAIPKSIILTKNADGDYDADYSVKMVGCDIAPTKQVTVSSNAEIEISRDGSEDKKTATNDMDKSVDKIQSKITFADKAKDVTYAGYINAGVLTSGSWQAQTTFTVALEDKPIIREAGLYDAKGKMLCALTKEQVETDYEYFTSLPKTLGVTKTQVAEAVIPEGATKIGDYAFDSCSNLTSVTIPNSVKSIGNSVFNGCSSLTSVKIPNRVKSIGKGAFSNCTSLTSVEIPNSITSIVSGAFGNCTSLKSVTIPNSVTSIGESAFFECTGLTSVTIPNRVTSIERHAFNGCTSLKSVRIPNSVTSIGAYAFNNVPHIYYNGTATGRPWGAKVIN